MDILTLIGLLLGSAAVIGGSILKGSGLAALWNGAAFMIVVVGTFAAILVQTPLTVFVRALRIMPWVFRPPALEHAELIDKVVLWSDVARKKGLLGLEDAAESEPDEFVRKGLQALVDGAEPEAIRAVLEVDLDTRERFDTQAARVFEGLGIYAPTLGIIGAVMGLMAVMQNLADPSKLGSGIAAAFVATIYGIGFANLVFLPAAAKLKGAVQAQSQLREMTLEGLMAIAEGENPRNIEVRLQGYVSG